MDLFNDRARAREAALRVRGMLSELRGAPKDTRDFLVFDRRGDWKDLGVGDEHMEMVDLRDDAMLDRDIAQADAAARALGHVDENDVINDDGGQAFLYGGAGDDTLADKGFRQGNGVSSPDDLRRQQLAFKAAARDWSRGQDAGGWYGDVGLGMGPGFNLHVDRQGVTPSVGAGYFGTAKLGYADDLDALRAQRQNDRVFGGIRLNKTGLGVDVRYRADPRSIVIDRVTGSIGPVEGSIDRRRGFSVDVPLELGAEAGSGLLKALPTRPWKR